MMKKEGIGRISRFLLLVCVLIVGFILIFWQCSENNSIKEIYDDTSLKELVIKNEGSVDVSKANLSQVTPVSESKEKVNDLPNRTHFADKKKAQVLKNDRAKVITSQRKLAVQAYVKPVSATSNATKLKEELKLIAAKVRLLEEQVRVLFDKMKDFRNKDESKFLAKDSKRHVDGEEVLIVDNSIFTYPSHVFAGGLSTYKDWDGVGLQGSYAYRMNKYLSLGGQVNAFFKDSKYKGDRRLYVGLRANVHILPLFIERSNFDLYLGGTAGVCRDYGYEFFDSMWYLGGAYDFNKRLGVFAEAGSIGVLGLRLNF